MRESESTNGEGETSFCWLFSDMGSQAAMDMSWTLAAISDSMLPDDSLENGGVNALGFLACLHDTSVSSGMEAAENKIMMGGGMDGFFLNFQCWRLNPNI